MNKEYVIIDENPNKTRYGTLPFYDVGSNSFFGQLPFATFFKSFERAEIMLKRAKNKHPDKTLTIKNVDEL